MKNIAIVTSSLENLDRNTDLKNIVVLYTTQCIKKPLCSRKSMRYIIRHYKNLV